MSHCAEYPICSIDCFNCMNCTGECCISFKCTNPINYEDVVYENGVYENGVYKNGVYKRCQQECKGCAKYYINAITMGYNIVNSANILERMIEVLNS